MSKGEANNNSLSPLWLSYVCNELRVFGEFSTLNKKIENFPSNLTELIVQIMNRVNLDFGENAVIDIMCFICISSNGIPENEMCPLLQSCGHTINRLECSQIGINLKNFLNLNSQYSCQVLRFSDRRIYTVISVYNFIPIY